MINSLWPSGTIRWQGNESTLAQVMACCLMAPSLYLNQCWLIITKVLWHSSEGIIMRRPEDTIQQNKIENYIFRTTFRSPRSQRVCMASVCMLNSLATGRFTHDPLLAKFFTGNKTYFTFHVIHPHWFGAGSWNPSLGKTWTYLFYIVNIMAADVLVTKWARASATMILTLLNRDDSVPAC